MAAMSTEDKKGLHRRFYEEVVNRGDADAIDEIMAPDFVGHTPGNPDVGRDGLKQAFASLSSSFSNTRVNIERQISDGDFVASHVTISGTHTGDLFGIPATGKDVSYPGIEIVRIADGKIAEFWGLLDMLTMMQQIGVAPSDGPPEE